MSPTHSTPRGPAEIEGPYLLVVEGPDDERFFGALAAHMGIDGLQCLPADGRTEFKKYLGALSKTPGFAGLRSIGVVRDADDDADSAFRSVCQALQKAGLSVPSAPSAFCRGQCRVGILILPPASKSGALEDLILAAVADDPVMACLEAYFNCLNEIGLSLPRNRVHLSKMKVHVFIGSKKAGIRLLGEAADARLWDWDAPAFDPVRKFLTSLCQDGGGRQV